jgi:hypothetical protein
MKAPPNHKPTITWRANGKYAARDFSEQDEAFITCIFPSFFKAEQWLEGRGYSFSDIEARIEIQDTYPKSWRPMTYAELESHRLGEAASDQCSIRIGDRVTSSKSLRTGTVLGMVYRLKGNSLWMVVEDEDGVFLIPEKSAVTAKNEALSDR